MDPLLEQWRAGGQTFDHLGWEVFFRREGTGPELLLVHGYPFSSWDWHAIWPALTARFTVTAPDMIGMGFSEKPVRYDYTVDRHATMHAALLAHLGVERCHVLAHDLGVSVAQELLARHEEGYGPPALESVAFLNGGLFHEAYQPRPIQVALSKTVLGTLAGRYPRLLLGDRVFGPVIRGLFGPDTQPDAAQLARLFEVLDFRGGRSVTHLVGRFVLDRPRQRDRWVEAMRRTGVPLRFIDGPADPNSGSHMAERFRELLPGADLVLLGERIGHWPQLEDPDGVVEAVLAFAG